ncbi:hypothetical protein [Sinomonas sp. ASV322]|uniref:hypothetical protein n=1 Tax=Sinomonas sp. ASV322 TaxID=3041920 RepID=UPI0027DD17D9|nr:hypothetical protein [Sinomonas sp. ASV322]MDQ4501717.1 hypothetical protein [Sinomonas sp. ASV322]
MLAAFASCGFDVEQIVEPDPLPSMAEIDPQSYTQLTRCPAFILFSLKKRQGA